MDGKIHHYWSLLFSTFLLTILTYAFNKNIWFLLISIILHVLCAIAHARERETDFKIEDAREHAKRNEHNLDLDKEVKKWTSRNTTWRKISWSIVYFTVFFVVFLSDFIEDKPKVTSVTIAFLSVLLSISGAYFADIDFNWGVDEHRNPLTHSYVLGLVSVCLAMVGFGYELRYMVLLPSMFCMGFASHLFLDCIPKSTRGVSNMLKELFANWNNSPGDIRYIPELWEHKWLFFSGVLMSALFGISIPRFYGTHGFDYDVLITESGAIIWNEYMIAFAIIGSVGTLLWVLLYMYARSVTMKKRADRKDRKESEKKAKKEKKEKKEQSSNNEKEDTIPDSIKESVESDAKVVTKKTTRKKKTTEIKD